MLIDISFNVRFFCICSNESIERRSNFNLWTQQKDDFDPAIIAEQ